MTLTSPAYVISGAGGHGAQLFRQSITSLSTFGGWGIVQAQDFTVSQNGTPNMSVNVGAGRIWVPGTSLATVNPGGGAYFPQGAYFAENDATVNLPISASNPTNPRIDTIICQIQDAFYAGTPNSASLGVVTGTPTSGASYPTNLLGAGTVPVSSSVLAYVNVPANAATIVTANISNVASMLVSRLILASTRAPIGIDGGQATVNFPASATATALTVFHGLGRSPIAITFGAADVGVTTQVTAGWSSPSSTQFILQARASASLNQTLAIDWIAVG